MNAGTFSAIAPRRTAQMAPLSTTHAWLGAVSRARPCAPASRRRPAAANVASGSAGPRKAPSLADGPSTSGRPPLGEPPAGGGPPPVAPRPSLKRLLRPLADLRLAIAELAAIAALSAVGTIIEQNKPLAYYVENYPEEGKKVLGFLSYDLLYFLQFDHIYTAPYFLGLLVLLAASLAACTTTTQWPTARAANRWRFKRAAPAFERLDVARRLPAAAVRDVAAALAARGYRVFVHGAAAYAFKGLAGRLGPIGVHASMLAVMAGITVGALGGYSGTAMIPVGSAAPVAGLLRPASPAARLPAGGGTALRVDAFRIDYRDDGSVRQFFSDVAVEDAAGRTLAAKTVSVNQPLRFGGVTAYQTDWSVAAVRVRVAGGGFVGDSDGEASAGGGDASAAAGAAAAAAPGRAFALPCASLEGQPGVAGKLYAAFLPLAAPDAPGAAPRGLSFLARDLQTVTVYDAAGAFAGVRRPGSGKPLVVDGVTVTIESLTGATGLELKHDPGVPLVYLGFGGMCVTTVVSYLSHSQVWAAQAGGDVLVGGRSNRAKFGFERELDAALDGVPEAAAAGPPAA